jgi:hypothetical protein
MAAVAAMKDFIFEICCEVVNRGYFYNLIVDSLWLGES